MKKNTSQPARESNCEPCGACVERQNPRMTEIGEMASSRNGSDQGNRWS